MDTKEKENITNSGYSYLYAKFTPTEIASRFDYVNDLLEDYIVQKQYKGRVAVSQDLVEHIIIDFFVDIDRLKGFQEIIYPNENKIYAYLSYWILRHKPLQMLNFDGQDDLAFVNESFVADFLCSYLFSDPENVSLLADNREKVDEFVKTLEYHFSYRAYSAQNIELMLLAFQAGRNYQYSVDYQS